MTTTTRLLTLEARCDWLTAAVVMLAVICGILVLLFLVTHSANERRLAELEAKVAGMREREKMFEQWQQWINAEVAELRRRGGESSDDWWLTGGVPPWER